MKNSSFEIKKNNILDKNKNMFNNNPKKRRANSYINILKGINYFDNKYKNFDLIEPNFSNRNRSNITAIISLKQTEKDELIKGLNDFNKRKNKNKKSNKKKNINKNTILNNTQNSINNKIYPKNYSSNSKLKKSNSKNSSSNLIIKDNILKTNNNKKQNQKLKNLRMNTFNNKNKPKNNINTSYINNHSILKYNDDKMIKTINITFSNKENNTLNNNNTDSEINHHSNITFGKSHPYRIPSDFVYIKKNKLCYPNSNNIYKSKNKSNINSTSFSTATTVDKQKEYNPIEKAIKSINISEFRIEEDKESDKNNSISDISDENDDICEENINTINVSYIGKYKTIEQIEKQIANTIAVNRIINNNIYKINQKNKDIKINNEEDDSKILMTATFGSMETEKMF